LLAPFGSGYVITLYILFCAIVRIISTALLPDDTNCDVSEEHIGAYSSLRRTVDGSFPGRVG
jgi:hypothetical protein